MNIRSVARTLTAIAASSALLIASAGTAWAQHSGGGSHGGGVGGGGGFHGGAVGGGLHGGGYHGGFYGGYHGGYHGGYYGGFRGGWHGYGWGWRPGWGWWWGGWGIPLGAYLSVLPWYYSTIWWDGVPYYYANSDYYVWNGTANQYEQVQPPPEVLQQGSGPGAPGVAPGAQESPGAQELYAYPMHEQSPEQQARDKRECREWASGQMAGGAPAPGVAPGAPGPAPQAAPPMPPNVSASGPDYLRAEAACLEARGYNVK